MTANDPSPADRKPVVLFLCVGNSARSQMAEAILKRHAGDHFEVYSAGLRPRPIHPLTIHVLEEAGLDASALRPKPLRQFLGRLAVHCAITVCAAAEEDCPTLWPGALSRLSWPFPDPAGADGTEREQLEAFRAVREGPVVGIPMRAVRPRVASSWDGGAARLPEMQKSVLEPAPEGRQRAPGQEGLSVKNADL